MAMPSVRAPFAVPENLKTEVCYRFPCLYLRQLQKDVLSL